MSNTASPERTALFTSLWDFANAAGGQLPPFAPFGEKGVTSVRIQRHALGGGTVNVLIGGVWQNSACMSDLEQGALVTFLEERA
jgi:hypothetical protein